MKVGQCVVVKPGCYRTSDDEKFTIKTPQQGWIGFHGGDNGFGGCPPVGEIIIALTCWVKLALEKRKPRGIRATIYIEVALIDLKEMITVEVLKKDFEKRVENLQKTCQHPKVDHDTVRNQIPAFYEMDSPDWRPEYTVRDVYQCEACAAYLKPTSRGKSQWAPGAKGGILRK